VPVKTESIYDARSSLKLGSGGGFKPEEFEIGSALPLEKESQRGGWDPVDGRGGPRFWVDEPPWDLAWRFYRLLLRTADVVTRVR
jgi:hypothetical protein